MLYSVGLHKASCMNRGAVEHKLFIIWMTPAWTLANQFLR